MKKFSKKILTALIIFIFLFSYSVLIFADEIEENSVVLINDTQDNNDEINETETNSDEQEESNPEEEIKELEEQKNNLENAISDSEFQIGVVEGELSQALEEIEILSTKIEEKKQEISDLEYKEKILINLISEEEEKLKEYTERYEKEKELLEKRLVVMYEMGETKYIDVLLRSSSLSDFLSRYYLVTEISEADYKLVSSVKSDKQKSELISQSLTEKKEELEKDKSEKEKYEISLSNMEILKNNKRNQLSEEEIALFQKIENYRNEIALIESEIKELSLQNLGEKYIGGDMVWPTPGYTRITSQFGMRTHPITGIYKLHTGTDIGAPYGSTFIAANDGVVLKAEYNTAYGNMVMIDHGGGIVTLYAHGSEILVSAGDIVSQSQPVLKVGSTGYSTGPHAHFEIRINGEYVNPLDYVSPDNGLNKKENEEIVVDLSQ